MGELGREVLVWVAKTACSLRITGYVSANCTTDGFLPVCLIMATKSLEPNENEVFGMDSYQSHEL